MSTDPFHETTRTRVAKSLVTALGIIGVAIAAFTLAAYLWNWIDARIPLGNLVLAVMLCIAGIVLTSMSIHTRASWKGAVEIGSLAIACTLAAVFAGFLGVVITGFSGMAVQQLLERLRPRRRRTDEA